MKRRGIIALVTACILTLGAAGCSSPSGSGSAQENGGTAQAEETKTVTIKQSPDKYTWYMKNYVGMNAAAVGYESLGGEIRDRYGDGNILIVFVAEDGTYLDPQDEEIRKEYVVVGQNLEPNTKIEYTFQLDENGEEYSLIKDKNYDEIVLSVAKVGSFGKSPDLTKIESSDRYTRYVKDYTGRNLAACGYISLGGTFNDHYGNAFVQFDITADDGSYVDINDEEMLSQYVVVAQNVEPNTPIALTYTLKEDGSEYDNLIDTKSLDSIGLTVRKIEQE